ncbi:MAG: hypothetical protein M1818_007698 [Claussenomyces sp. TS43310]|nr:MAG: hypothetical protein M1818_007698 [Claussenomyces sp. TS43310]
MGPNLLRKIPSLFAGRPMYSTASEVAVLTYNKAHTTIPIPTVLAWNSEVSNAAGAEYIIMESVPEKQLIKIWDDMDEEEQSSIMLQRTKWENDLAKILQKAARGSRKIVAFS